MRLPLCLKYFFMMFLFSKSLYAEYPFELVEGPGHSLKIIWKQEKIEQSQIKNRFVELTKHVEALLAPDLDPYQGVDTTPELCRKDNLPQFQVGKSESRTYKIFHIYSSQHYVLAACPAQGQVVKTQFLLMYCQRDKQLYRIQYFYPKENAWLQKPVAKCLDP